MPNPFLPTKEQWDHATAQLDAIRLMFSIPAGKDVVPVVQAYRQENMASGLFDLLTERAEIRTTFAHLPGPEQESLPQLCARIADQHRRQAETIESLTRQRDELVAVLDDVINQACQDGDALDSMALSAYAAGLRALAEHGKVAITHEYGRRVIAQPITQSPTDSIGQ